MKHSLNKSRVEYVLPLVASGTSLLDPVWAPLILSIDCYYLNLAQVGGFHLQSMEGRSHR
jgi:hypothetical protein